MSRCVLTVTQRWQGKTYTIDHTAFANEAYPIWLTIASMDLALYREAGVVLPSRMWTARPVD